MKFTLKNQPSQQLYSNLNEKFEFGYDADGKLPYQGLTSVLLDDEYDEGVIDDVVHCVQVVNTLIQAVPMSESVSEFFFMGASA